MTYLLWITLALTHLVGMAMTHGMERRRTFRPDPFVYVPWEFWLIVWVGGVAASALRDGLRWTFAALDEIGYRIGR